MSSPQVPFDPAGDPFPRHRPQPAFSPEDEKDDEKDGLPDEGEKDLS
jgi:hypothetical protein